MISIWIACGCEDKWLLVAHEAEPHFGEVFFYIPCPNCNPQAWGDE